LSSLKNRRVSTDNHPPDKTESGAAP